MMTADTPPTTPADIDSPGSTAAAGRRHERRVPARLLVWGRAFAVLVFGLILPAILTVQAYLTASRLDSRETAADTLKAISTALPPSVTKFSTANDYALFGLVFLEASSQRSMSVKQNLKIAVLNIGFAVTSLGLLFILLGIDAGGLDATAKADVGWTVSVKMTSTGVAVFVLGALMASAGGLIPNAYSTVGLPGFGAVGGQRPAALRDLTAPESDAVLQHMKRCEAPLSSEDVKRKCVSELLRTINEVVR